MTLIALVYNQSGVPYLLSDLALSNPKAAPISGKSFPFQKAKGRGFDDFPEALNETIVDMEQKMVIFGRHIVLWAGRKLYAKTCIKKLYEMQESLCSENFQSIVDSAVSPENLTEISLIYCSVSGGSVSVAGIHVSQRVVGDTKIVVAGDGAYMFLDAADMSGFSISDDDKVKEQLFGRLLHLVGSEMTDDSYYYHHIGVGYEIATLSEGKSWKKVHYCTAVYSSAKDKFGLSGLVNLSYLDDDLIISARYRDFIEPEAWGEDGWLYLPFFSAAPDKRFFAQEDEDIYIVPDFLRRSEVALSVDVARKARSKSLGGGPDLTLSVCRMSGEDLDRFESRAHWPGAFGGFFVHDDQHAVAGYAFYFREIEEIYLGRKFVPAPEFEEQYRRSRQRWMRHGLTGVFS